MVSVEAREIIEKDVDDYGRVNLGRDLAGRTVQLAILDVDKPETTEEKIADVVEWLRERGEVDRAEELAAEAGLEIEAQ